MLQGVVQGWGGWRECSRRAATVDRLKAGGRGGGRWSHFVNLPSKAGPMDKTPKACEDIPGETWTKASE